MQKKIHKKKYNQGFSLVEFIVVILIFSVMSSVSLFNYSGYSENIKSTNLAQDIALTIRQAQVYGASAAGQNIGRQNFNIQSISDITQDRSVRGIALITQSAEGLKELVLFGDNDQQRNREYNPSNDTIIGTRTVADQEFNVSVCLLDSSDGSSIEGVRDMEDHCTQWVTETASPVSITFQRPRPDAVFRFDSINYDQAFIVIHRDSRPDIGDKYIQVSPLGQISVKQI